MAGLLSPAAGGFFAAPRIDNLITSADVLRSKKPGSYLRGSISSYSPSVLERAEQKITGLLSYVLPRKEAAKLARNATSFANDFTPAGDAVTAAQAGTDFRQGNILSGFGNSALAAIGVVPGVGDVAAKGLKKGIRAFHGSPHDFDRFSLDKIGTGEGAQAYGHGLYFAENENVAKQYRDKLSPLGVQPVSPSNPIADAAAQRLHWEINRGGDAQTLIAKMERDLSSGRLSWDQTAADQLNYLKSGAGLPETASSGRMYEVNINADPDSLLDWDAPIAKQSEQVQAGVREYLRGIGKYPMDRFDQFAASSTGANISLRQPGQVEAIRGAGIPGIKYLDQGSRGAGDGSRNLVIFDDSIIDILNKY